MKLRKRIIYYVIGFVLGLILTVVIFADKDIFGFMPSNRVLQDIQNSNIMISPAEEEKLHCMNIDENFIFEMIENGDVNFSSSQTSFSKEEFIINGNKVSLEVKKYELEYNNKLLSFWIAPKDSISILHTINSNCKPANEDQQNIHVMYMPEALVFKKMLDKELWLNQNITCAMECHQISKIDIDNLFKQGEILFEESFPYRKPNPVYFVKLKIHESDWIFWVELGDTKTRIKYFVNVSGIDLKGNQYLITEIFNQAKNDDSCGCFDSE
ncbi:MAG: hypothetical protein H6600_07305 [Flavobacteriales bacterium]|nr:hypothetical protein [Flavobacteriales bacterium]MCB9198248.1 hypothetical protein [Flavobacteriales bacterium]